MAAGTAADLTPGLGDAKGIGEAIQNPTKANIAAATVGVVPVVGDIAGKAIKAAAKQDGAFKALSDGQSMSTDDALTAANNVLGDTPTEIADGVFRSGDFQVRMTDSDLATTGNHAGAPHMNFEKLGTNSRGKTVVKENKHIFLPEE